MGFSKEWEQCYKENKQIVIWPWADLISYVMRYIKPSGSNFKVLELGCGSGANIPFFKHLGVSYYAVEGSETIVKMLHEKFPEFKDTIKVGDFTKEVPFEEQFDLIFDRAAITHNTTSAIKNTISLIFQKLKPNGKFIGIDWFSTIHSDYKIGKICEDLNTKEKIEKGQFVGIGCVHFSDKEHLLELFSEFKIDIMEHKIYKREIPSDNHTFATWNFIACKE